MPTEAHSEQIDEPYCSLGVGSLHHDVWSVDESEDAVDVQSGNNKIRMFGFNAWFDKTAYGSTVVNEGCNVWDIVVHFDAKLARRSGSVIGVISEECMGVQLNDAWYNFAENTNIDAFAVYTRTGGRVYQGMYQGLEPSFFVDEPGTKIRVILDFDGDDGANLFLKWEGGYIHAYHFIEPAFKYRLAVSSQMEESFKLL